MNKFLIAIIIVVIAGISIFAYQSMQNSSGFTGQAFEDATIDIASHPKITPQMGTSKDDSRVNKQTTIDPKPETNAADSATTQLLPFDIKLLGLVFSNVASKSYTQLNNAGNIAEFVVDEQVNDTAVYVKRINKASVILEFESVDYELRLGDSNSLEESQLIVEFEQMSAKDIGSRPRTMQHIVTLLPNLFNDGGQLVIPGQNPALFSAARFKEGDVLLDVNGFDIDDERSFSELQQHIRQAQTLKFKVNRAGRQITLYLDIPSEALKL